MDYDVIYIGSGNAAWQGGRFLRKEGLKVLIVEESLYGGACANRGCNSKALLDAPYEIKALTDNFEGVGKSGDFEVDWPSLMKFKQKRIAGMSIFLDGKFDEYDLDVAHGKGVILDEHTVKVADKTFTTDKIVICTGLKPVIPDISGKEYLHDSTDFLDIEELPKHAIIIGAGFVGMEFASILAEAGLEADVIIDFSHPSVLEDLLAFAKERKIPAVIATTGLNDEQIESIKVASNDVPLFFSANMSIGVSLVSELAKKAAKVLQGSFDIEIVEAHHNQKIDAPSGTALMLADSISEALDEKPIYEFDRHSKRMKRTKNEIGIHAVRGGTIVGEHEIIFAGPDEVIKISHSAYSKQLFANGSVNAGLFLVGKNPGFYSMKDLVNES